MYKRQVFRLIEDKAIINRLGFPNDGMDTVSNRIKYNLPKGICGINIGPNKDNATSSEDYILCFDKLCQLASYITINISSPNTPNLRSQHDDDKLTKLIDVIQKRRNANKSSILILLSSITGSNRISFPIKCLNSSGDISPNPLKRVISGFGFNFSIALTRSSSE